MPDRRLVRMLRLNVDIDPLRPALTEHERIPGQRIGVPATVNVLEALGSERSLEIRIRRQRSAAQGRPQASIFDDQPHDMVYGL